MKRDKIISLRVNGELLSKVQEIIDRRTDVFEFRGRKHYTYKDGTKTSYDKFTVADLLENAMQEYIARYSEYDAT